jgi:hypothetical protein
LVCNPVPPYVGVFEFDDVEEPVPGGEYATRANVGMLTEGSVFDLDNELASAGLSSISGGNSLIVS